MQRISVFLCVVLTSAFLCAYLCVPLRLIRLLLHYNDEIPKTIRVSPHAVRNQRSRRILSDNARYSQPRSCFQFFTMIDGGASFLTVKICFCKIVGLNQKRCSARSTLHLQRGHDSDRAHARADNLNNIVFLSISISCLMCPMKSRRYVATGFRDCELE